jgi:hypothetical protein
LRLFIFNFGTLEEASWRGKNRA